MEEIAKVVRSRINFYAIEHHEPQNLIEEKVRKLILEAKEERVPKSFEIYAPDTPSEISSSIHQLFSRVNKGISAKWYHLALYWGFLLSTGEETWDSLCNEPSKDKYIYIVHWKNDNYMYVGGSTLMNEEEAKKKIKAHQKHCAKRDFADVYPMMYGDSPKGFIDYRGYLAVHASTKYVVPLGVIYP